MEENKEFVELSPDKELINSRSGIQVIARAAAILRTLSESPDGLSLAEIAKKLKLPRSTVQRIVYALDHENLVIAASTSKGVRLGPALISLASKTKFEISELFRPTLQTLANESGESAMLSIFSGHKMIFVDQVSGTHDLRIESPIGRSLTLHSSSPGKAVMAIMEQDELDKLLSVITYEKLTPNTAGSRAELENELEKVRREGVAFDMDENIVGISAVAFGMSLPNGEYAAISIPVPSQRFQQQKDQITATLKKHCLRLEKIYSNKR